MLPVMSAEANVNERRGSCAPGSPRSVRPACVNANYAVGFTFSRSLGRMSTSIDIARSW
jgi:hypothetical protein